jgi:transposase
LAQGRWSPRSKRGYHFGQWARSLLERKPARLVTVAIANKTVRIVWAVLAGGESYRAAATA